MESMNQSKQSTEQDSSVYSVTLLTKLIRLNLEKEFPSVWVEGEVSNVSKHSSGHVYFTLKDENAQISVVLFRSFLQKVAFDLMNGQQILVFGRVSVYEKRGSYQLYAEIVEPRGVGALQLAFQQLKLKLQKEGLFDEEHKKAIPSMPRTIGVVTSPTGAAIRDIFNIVSRRFSNVHILLYPVKVQGEGAASEIAQAIDAFNQHNKCDVLIVGRGGGSIEDLWAFNEEVVARAIFNSAIPVISAVGHEIDFTISDFVSDLRAPTPSAAAELVVQRKEDLEIKIDAITQDLNGAMSALIDDVRVKLSRLRDSYAFRQPKEIVYQYVQRVDEFTRQLHNYVKTVVLRQKGVFERIAGTLHALSPLAILSRGYSITFLKEEHNYVLLKDVTNIKIGDYIRTKFAQGSCDAQIINIDK